MGHGDVVLLVYTVQESKRANPSHVQPVARLRCSLQACLVGSRQYNSFGSHGASEHVQLIHFHTLEACCTYLKDTAGRHWAGYCSRSSLVTQGSCSHTLEVLCLHSDIPAPTLYGQARGKQHSHTSYLTQWKSAREKVLQQRPAGGIIVCSLEQHVPIICDALAHSNRWTQEHTDHMQLQPSSRLPFWLTSSTC